MKIAFVGKGGSGKTTMASLFARRVASFGHPTMAYDADVNQRLKVALGIDPKIVAMKPVLGEYIDDIKDYLRGDNPLIPSAELMLKTTPPGPGSRLLTVGETNSLYEKIFTDYQGIRFAATGGFNDDDLGKRCYHSKTAAVELILGHLIDRQDEFVVVDMVAGAEIFGSGMFARFDAIVVVVEPTMDSLGVYEQVISHTSPYDLNVWVVGNKIDNESDKGFLSSHIDTKNQPIVGWFGQSQYVKAAARGEFKPLDDLEEENLKVLDQIREEAMETPKNWALFNRLAREFHRRAVSDWGNHAGMSDQIVDFELGEDLLPATI